MNFCKECGARINPNAEICPTCGCRVKGGNDALETILNGRSRIVAVLLAFFLGSFGIHKFYLGSLGWGVMYLLFSWTGIPAFVGVIESILLLVMDESTFNSRFN